MAAAPFQQRQRQQVAGWLAGFSAVATIAGSQRSLAVGGVESQILAAPADSAGGGTAGKLVASHETTCGSSEGGGESGPSQSFNGTLSAPARREKDGLCPAVCVPSLHANNTTDGGRARCNYIGIESIFYEGSRRDSRYVSL